MSKECGFYVGEAKLYEAECGYMVEEHGYMAVTWQRMHFAKNNTYCLTLSQIPIMVGSGLKEQYPCVLFAIFKLSWRE